MSEYACSWSGGKDSCLACWKAFSQGLELRYLLNFVNKDSGRSMSHNLKGELLSLQAQALGLPLLQKKVTWETYEAVFKEALRELKQEGITGLICGDLDLQEHRDWLERVCGEMGFEVVLPLWKMEPGVILTDFVNAGFEAVVVGAKAEFFSQDWLGRKVDFKLIEELTELKEKLGVHPCGEAGEYHTFVYNGPLFRNAVKIDTAVPVLKDKYWFLDISEYGLEKNLIEGQYG